MMKRFVKTAQHTIVKRPILVQQQNLQRNFQTLSELQRQDFTDFQNEVGTGEKGQ